MLKVLGLLRELAAPLLCRLGLHRLYQSEIDVPWTKLSNDWVKFHHGEGLPARRCWFCGKTWREEKGC